MHELTLPIVPSAGLYLFGTDRRFARLFAAAWRRLPLHVRRWLRRYWQRGKRSMLYGREAPEESAQAWVNPVIELVPSRQLQPASDKKTPSPPKLPLLQLLQLLHSKQAFEDWYNWHRSKQDGRVFVFAHCTNSGHTLRFGEETTRAMPCLGEVSAWQVQGAPSRPFSLAPHPAGFHVLATMPMRHITQASRQWRAGRVPCPA